MSLALLLLAVVVVGVVVAVAAGRLPAGMPDPVRGSPHRPLPLRPLEADDVDALRFSVVPRGYRMDEVDAALTRLRSELAERDLRITALSSLSPAGGAPAPADPHHPVQHPVQHPTHQPTQPEGY